MPTQYTARDTWHAGEAVTPEELARILDEEGEMGMYLITDDAGCTVALVPEIEDAAAIVLNDPATVGALRQTVRDLLRYVSFLELEFGICADSFTDAAAMATYSQAADMLSRAHQLSTSWAE